MIAEYLTPDETQVALHKSFLRRSIRHHRSSLHRTLAELAPDYTNYLHQVIHTVCDGTGKTRLTIAAYLPTQTEPPLLPALSSLSRQGHTVLVPVVEPGRQLSWVQWVSEQKFSRNSLGIMEPLGTRHRSNTFIAADVQLIPALAFDRFGNRLGQGGGYYDRLLTPEVLSSPHCYGVAFSWEILDGIPHTSLDARVQRIITDQGIRELS